MLHFIWAVETKERRHKKTYINKSFVSFLFTSTDNKIGDAGAASLSESLKSNTTLSELNLGGEDQRKKTHKRHPSTIHSFSFLFSSIGNNIRETGAKSLSEALKSNTTLTGLNLYGEDKRIHTKDVHQQFTLFISLHFNRQQYWRHGSNITE